MSKKRTGGIIAGAVIVGGLALGGLNTVKIDPGYIGIIYDATGACNIPYIIFGTWESINHLITELLIFTKFTRMIGFYNTEHAAIFIYLIAPILICRF